MPLKTKEVLIVRRGRPFAYPWDQWERGDIETAERGTHFHVSAKNFARAVRLHAKAIGYSVAIKCRGDVVQFQFSKPKRKATKSA